MPGQKTAVTSRAFLEQIGRRSEPITRWITILLPSRTPRAIPREGKLGSSSCISSHFFPRSEQSPLFRTVDFFEAIRKQSFLQSGRTIFRLNLRCWRDANNLAHCFPETHFELESLIALTSLWLGLWFRFFSHSRIGLSLATCQWSRAVTRSPILFFERNLLHASFGDKVES